MFQSKFQLEQKTYVLTITRENGSVSNSLKYVFKKKIIVVKLIRSLQHSEPEKKMLLLIVVIKLL